MSTTIAMVQANVPLCQWRTFDAGNRLGRMTAFKEDTRRIAAIILRQCGHNEVVDLVAREFSLFPERLRIDFRTLANDQQAASGNVRKGLQRLDQKLGGELMRKSEDRVFNKRVETEAGVFYKPVKVNKSIAGAKQKYMKV